MRHKTKTQSNNLTGSIGVMTVGHMQPMVSDESTGNSNKVHSLPPYSRERLKEQRIALLEGHPCVKETTYEQCCKLVDLILEKAFLSREQKDQRKKTRTNLLHGLDKEHWGEYERFYVFNELARLSVVKDGKVSLFLPDDCTPTEQTSDDMQKGASAWT